MTYIPISPHERDAMLKTVGVKSLDDLFDAMPKPNIASPNLNLPPASLKWKPPLISEHGQPAMRTCANI
jgi:glycine cleavage system pyridoxal-binding protein P